MKDYVVVRQPLDGSRTCETCRFQDDDAAVAYILPLARGLLLEVWQDDRLVATVDERPCLAA